MSIQTTVAAAVWTNATRTLDTGTPAAPTTPQDYIAKAIWEYVIRTLGGYEIEGAPSCIVRVRPLVHCHASVRPIIRANVRIKI